MHRKDISKDYFFDAVVYSRIYLQVVSLTNKAGDNPQLAEVTDLQEYNGFSIAKPGSRNLVGKLKSWLRRSEYFICILIK